MQYLEYLIPIAIILGSFAAAKAVYWILEKYVKRLTKMTKTDIDDRILAALKRPVYIFIILFGIAIALQPYAAALPWFNKALMAVYILLAFYVAARVSNIAVVGYLRALTARTKSTLDDQIVVLIERFLGVFIIAIGLVMVLGQFGIAITPLIASLGIVGLVIALAAQESLSNVFAGIFLLIDQPFRVGDRVKVGNELGDIVSIGLRSTRIRTLDNNIFVIPNAELSKSQVTNYADRDPVVKVALDFGVAYGSDTSKVKKIIRNCLAKLEWLAKDREPVIFFWEMADSALIFRTIFWVNSYRSVGRARDALNEAVYSEFAKAGIEIPFPTRQLFVKELK
jgi:MscS family membrane protein